MANNRMFLVHRPTGLAIMLAKHSGYVWHSPPDSDMLNEFYDCVIDEVCKSGMEFSNEDFCVAMESCAVETQYVITEWQYEKGDVLRIKFKQKEGEICMTEKDI